MALYEGTPGPDFIDAFPLNEDDQMYGYAGNDTILGYDGNDYINGGDNDDTLYGEDGDDTLDGWIGNDILHGGNGNDYILGYDGNDQLNGNSGNDTLDGERGTDALNGGSGNDKLFGGDGNDTLDGGTGADAMDGGEGNDTYIVDNAGDSARELLGGGVDLVKSSVSAGPLAGMIENLTLTGSANINGTGNALANVINGNSGNNVLAGRDNNDTLNGGAGGDTLNGGNGNDKLTGGSGKDTLTGGTNNDSFIYKSVSDSPAGAGRDVITDFKGNGAAAGDKIDLHAIDANVLKSGNQDFIWNGSTAGGAGTLWYKAGVLHGNIDGDAPAEFQIQLTGAPPLHVSDIVL